MKHLYKIFLGLLLLSGLQFTTSGCVADGSVGGGVYYGSGYRDPWFRDGPWMDGHRGGYGGRRGGDVYISPPRVNVRVRVP